MYFYVAIVTYFWITLSVSVIDCYCSVLTYIYFVVPVFIVYRLSCSIFL